MTPAVRGLRAPVFSPDGQAIASVSSASGHQDIWLVPAEGGVAARVSNLGGVIDGFDASSNGDGFVFSRSSETEGSDIDYLPVIGGPERRLTHLAAAWAGVRKPIEVSFRSYDGLYVQGFLYLPPSVEPGQRCPALVQVHGGGTNSYMRRVPRLIGRTPLGLGRRVP